MNKAEYKQLSHDIRLECHNQAKMLEEVTGKYHSTRGYMHNVMVWRDSMKIDKYGNDLYTYRCIGDYEIGLIWEKKRNVDRRLAI